MFILKAVAFFFSAWLAMVFWGMVASDLALPTIGYARAMLVTIGLWLVVFPLTWSAPWRGSRPWARKTGRWEGRQASESGPDAVNVSALFTGLSRRVISKAFTGGNVRARFGAVELDLRNAAVDKRPALLNVDASFGGVEIYVPPAWNVELDVNALFGGVTDERRYVEGIEEGPPQLVITGRAFFGGVAVKD